MNASLTDLGGLQRERGSTATPSVAAPRRRWKTRVLLPGAIIAMVIVMLLTASAQTLLPATPVRVVPAIVKTVEGVSGTVTVQAPGWLEPDPHPHFVAALADGVISELLVLEGDVVERDQVVARMVDDDARLALQWADAELLRHRSALLAAEANLTAARLQMHHLVDRSRDVAVSEAAVAEARAEIERVQADLAVEQALLAELQDEYDRKSKLTESQAVSEASVARLGLRLAAQRATVTATEARGGVLVAKLDGARAGHTAASTHLELLILERQALSLAEAAVGTAEAGVVASEAARAEAALKLSRMEIRSPVGGVVLRRLVSPGSKMTREGPEHSLHVMHAYDPEQLQVRVDVPLADAAHVSVGQVADITVEVLPDRTFRGMVTRLVHEADIQKNTVEVKVAIEEPSVELKPDMLARVRFLARAAPTGGTLRQRVFAPAALVRSGSEGGLTALVVSSLTDGRGRVEQRSITAGAQEIDGWMEVEDGLQVGDLLIAEPTTGLEPGDRVRVTGEHAGTGG